MATAITSVDWMDRVAATVAGEFSDIDDVERTTA
ncbi:MAG: hypothetical protein GAK38_00853 [Xylophilus sp.]|nr:MAG: hypothetical protein GAK38_00853 [Xylophilus sp.]